MPVSPPLWMPVHPSTFYVSVYLKHAAELGRGAKHSNRFGVGAIYACALRVPRAYACVPSK